MNLSALIRARLRPASAHSRVYGYLLAFGLALSALFLFREWRLTGGVTGFPLDDSWIHYRFAANLRAGQGFSFNPGEPTPGSTSPLWVIWLALLGGGFILPAKLTGIAAYLGSGLLVYSLGEATGLNRGLALLAGAGTLAAGRLVWAAPSGMETAAFTLVSLLGFWLWARSPDGRLPRAVSLLFGAACLLRPEGYLLVLLAALVAGMKGWRSVLQHLLLAGLAAAPYPLFSLLTAGRLLPNTFYAKAGMGCQPGWNTLLFPAWVFFFDNPVMFVLVIAGAVALLWRFLRLCASPRPSISLSPRPRVSASPSLLASGLWLFLLPLASALLIPCVSFHVTRYTTPVVPFLMLFGARSAQSLSRSTRWQANRWLSPLLAAGIAVSFAITVVFWAPLFARSVADIQDLQVQAARWAGAHTPPTAVLAVNDVGAIGSLSGRKVIDLMGLTNPEVLPYLRSRGPGSRDSDLARYLEQKKPDYLIIFPNWFPTMLDQLPVEAVYRARLGPRRIAGIPNLTIAGGGELVVYKLDW